MKHLIIITFIAALVAGCGKEQSSPTIVEEIILFNGEPIVIGSVDPNIKVEATPTVYGTLDLADTTWLSQWVWIALRYSVDSITCNTICYELKECGE